MSAPTWSDFRALQRRVEALEQVLTADQARDARLFADALTVVQFAVDLGQLVVEEIDAASKT